MKTFIKLFYKADAFAEDCVWMKLITREQANSIRKRHLMLHLKNHVFVSGIVKMLNK